METKTCKECRRTLPVSQFYKQGRSKFTDAQYYTPRCRKCHRAYRQPRRSHETQYQRQWRTRRRRHYNAYMRGYRAQHPEREQYRAAVFRQLAHRTGRTGPRVARSSWQRTLDAFGHRCAYCNAGGNLTVDHFIPVSRGGTHNLSNLVPACLSCNSSKGQSLPSEWLSWAEYQDIQAILSLLFMV